MAVHADWGGEYRAPCGKVDCDICCPRPIPGPTPAERVAVLLKQEPRRFILAREEDVSGVSGTGIVAEGIEFSDGEVVIRWIDGEHKSTVVWAQGIEAVKAIHGHDGRTTVVFLDA